MAVHEGRVYLPVTGINVGSNVVALDLGGTGVLAPLSASSEVVKVRSWRLGESNDRLRDRGVVV